MEEESAAYDVHPTTESGEREPQPQDHSGATPISSSGERGTIAEAAPSETEAAPKTEAAPVETEAAGSDDMSGLREELKAELKAELKEQLKQELMQDMMKEGGGGGGVVGAAR